MSDAIKTDAQADEADARRSARIGLVLFLLYMALYAGFACLAAFHPEQMSKRPFGGVNVAIWYGMTLIVSPLLLATIYLLMCWRRSAP